MSEDPVDDIIELINEKVLQEIRQNSGCLQRINETPSSMARTHWMELRGRLDAVFGVQTCK